MHDGNRVLGLVPARGGSRGLPDKNTRPRAGRPLIAWTIETASACASIDDVVVSTDSERIARVATENGAQVPFMRAEHLARDDSRMIDVVLDAVDTLADAGRKFDIIALLQPTSPLRTTADIDDAFARLRESGGQAVVSVCRAEPSPLLAGTLPADGSLADFLRPREATANRQQLPEYFRLNGAVYLAEVPWLRERGSFVGRGAFAFVMPPERSVDIDTELDLMFAECLLKRSTKA
jgi:CMP-N,N'-diacetyllegionaminic acid synthase